MYPALEFTVGKAGVYEIEFAKLSLQILGISHQLSVNCEMFQLAFEICQLYLSTLQVKKVVLFSAKKTR